MATQDINQRLGDGLSRKCGSNCLLTEVILVLSLACSLPRLRKSHESERKQSLLFASVTSAYFRRLPRSEEGKRIMKINYLIIFRSLSSAFWEFSEAGE